MSNYTKLVNFAAKDSLPSGDANKLVKGTEINTELANIQTAVNSKADTASPTFTGTVTAATVKGLLGTIISGAGYKNQLDRLGSFGQRAQTGAEV
jgi:hypothetical protein